jgi:hypothetical protein
MCSMLEVMVSASTRKWKALGVATKFEIVQACENSNMIKAKLEGVII